MIFRHFIYFLTFALFFLSCFYGAYGVNHFITWGSSLATRTDYVNYDPANEWHLPDYTAPLGDGTEDIEHVSWCENSLAFITTKSGRVYGLGKKDYVYYEGTLIQLPNPVIKAICNNGLSGPTIRVLSNLTTNLEYSIIDPFYNTQGFNLTLDLGVKNMECVDFFCALHYSNGSIFIIDDRNSSIYQFLPSTPSTPIFQYMTTTGSVYTSFLAATYNNTLVVVPYGEYSSEFTYACPTFISECYFEASLPITHLAGGESGGAFVTSNNELFVWGEFNGTTYAPPASIKDFSSIGTIIQIVIYRKQHLVLLNTSSLYVIGGYYDLVAGGLSLAYNGIFAVSPDWSEISKYIIPSGFQSGPNRIQILKIFGGSNWESYQNRPFYGVVVDKRPSDFPSAPQPSSTSAVPLPTISSDPNKKYLIAMEDMVGKRPLLSPFIHKSVPQVVPLPLEVNVKTVVSCEDKAYVFDDEGSVWNWGNVYDSVHQDFLPSSVYIGAALNKHILYRPQNFSELIGNKMLYGVTCNSLGTVFAFNTNTNTSINRISSGTKYSTSHPNPIQFVPTTNGDTIGSRCYSFISNGTLYGLGISDISECPYVSDYGIQNLLDNITQTLNGSVVEASVDTQCIGAIVKNLTHETLVLNGPSCPDPDGISQNIETFTPLIAHTKQTTSTQKRTTFRVINRAGYILDHDTKALTFFGDCSLDVNFLLPCTSKNIPLDKTIFECCGDNHNVGIEQFEIINGTGLVLTTTKELYYWGQDSFLNYSFFRDFSIQFSTVPRLLPLTDMLTDGKWVIDSIVPQPGFNGIVYFLVKRKPTAPTQPRVSSTILSFGTSTTQSEFNLFGHSTTGHFNSPEEYTDSLFVFNNTNTNRITSVKWTNWGAAFLMSDETVYMMRSTENSHPTMVANLTQVSHISLSMGALMYVDKVHPTRISQYATANPDTRPYVDAINNITSLECTAQSCIVTTSNSIVFLFNRAYEECTNISNLDPFISAQVTLSNIQNQYSIWILNNTHMLIYTIDSTQCFENGNIFSLNQTMDISSMTINCGLKEFVAGQGHVLALFVCQNLNSRTILFGAGINNYGQVSFEPSEYISDLTSIQSPNNEVIVSIAATNLNSLAYTELGNLYVWGYNMRAPRTATIPPPRSSHFECLLYASIFDSPNIANIISPLRAIQFPSNPNYRDQYGYSKGGILSIPRLFSSPMDIESCNSIQFFMVSDVTYLPVPYPVSPTTPANPIGCRGPAPAAAFQCIGGKWVFSGNIAISDIAPLIISEGETVVLGNITISGGGLKFELSKKSDGGSKILGTLNVTGCVFINSQIPVSVSAEALKQLASNTQYQQVFLEASNNIECNVFAEVEGKRATSNRTRLSNGQQVSSIIKVNSQSSCRRPNYETQASTENDRVSFSFVLSVDSSRCTNWWVIMLCAIGGFLIIVLVVILVFLLSSKARKVIQPYYGSNS